MRDDMARVIVERPRIPDHSGDAWGFLQPCTLSGLAPGVRHEGELSVER